MTQRVFVTGVGVVAPTGLGIAEYWAATLAGRSGISRIDDRHVGALAGRITGFDAARHLPGRLLPQTDVSTRLALTAADWAINDAGVRPGDRDEYDMGVMTSNACGGFDFTHRQFDKLWHDGPQHVSVYESFAWFYAVTTGQVSIRHGLRGPGTALVGEQAGGLDAIGYARRAIRRGTPLVISGGVDSALGPWGRVAHLSSGTVSTTDDPGQAYLPFAAAASGHVPGEGGAILVLEGGESLDRRGDRPRYGEIAGYAATFDPAPGSGRPPGLRRAAELALEDAGVTTADVGVVFADAAGTAEFDRAEAEAVTGLFGPYGVPVTAPKAGTGRLFSGGGPLDVVTACLALREGVIPPTPHDAQVAAGHRIDLVQNAPRERNMTVALVLARGRWGFNSAIVVRG
ncbi:ketosynthase chain-length factor [Frankia sp. AiPs1]|uniref:ketosynthase chain-length factor n=1 Tax=Frankia sp. AiPs1 TaxID=573493 RepID=UPI002042D7FE|nr:ketosynthase chain-length factor [Frankia sp. AiPs1]MCM3920956.1 ketosynthase chain-length factor [Frankia sp. AiPs1]